jgi:SAM-dependent methyltransferase
VAYYFSRASEQVWREASPDIANSGRQEYDNVGVFGARKNMTTSESLAGLVRATTANHRIVNVGCGAKASDRCLNLDWSFYLRFKRLPFSSAIAPLIFHGDRLAEFHKLVDSIVVHDLRRGIPCADETVDVVYHSHFLEHLDRRFVAGFLAEVRRVLKPGGIHRIVVPDLEKAVRLYVEHLDACRAGTASGHDEIVSMLVWQMVQKEAHGTARQPPFRRWIENRVLGDARRRGQSHQWMYDEVNLREVLEAAGFVRIRRMAYDHSDVPEWGQIGLDLNDRGQEYKPESMYIEASRD